MLQQPRRRHVHRILNNLHNRRSRLRRRFLFACRYGGFFCFVWFFGYLAFKTAQTYQILVRASLHHAYYFQLYPFYQVGLLILSIDLKITVKALILHFKTFLNLCVFLYYFSFRTFKTSFFYVLGQSAKCIAFCFLRFLTLTN